MAEKPVLTQLTSGNINPTVLNSLLDILAEAISDCLSRDGVSTTPNSIQGNLDLNSKRIINLGIPLNNNDAARLVDISDSDATGAASAQLREDIKSLYVGNSLTITDLVSLDAIVDRTVVVGGFYEINDGGFGVYRYVSTEDKQNHNGINIIDPSHSATPGDTAWYTAENSGNGCYIRYDSGTVPAMAAGLKLYSDDATYDAAIPLQILEDYADSIGGMCIEFPHNKTYRIATQFFKGESVWNCNKTKFLIDSNEDFTVLASTASGDYAGLSAPAVATKSWQNTGNPYKDSYPTQELWINDIELIMRRTFTTTWGQGVSTPLLVEFVSRGMIDGLVYRGHADTATSRTPWNGPDIIGGVNNLTIKRVYGYTMSNPNGDMIWNYYNKSATGGDANTITWVGTLPSVTVGMRVKITSGTGSGQYATITAVSANTIDHNGTFSPTPDNTSKFEVQTGQGGFWIRCFDAPGDRTNTNVTVENSVFHSNHIDEPLGVWTYVDYDQKNVTVKDCAFYTYDQRNAFFVAYGGTSYGKTGRLRNFNAENCWFETVGSSAASSVNTAIKGNYLEDTGVTFKNCTARMNLRLSGLFGETASAFDIAAVYNDVQNIIGGTIEILDDVNAGGSRIVKGVVRGRNVIGVDITVNDSVTSSGSLLRVLDRCTNVSKNTLNHSGISRIYACENVEGNKMDAVVMNCNKVVGNEITVNGNYAAFLSEDLSANSLYWKRDCNISHNTIIQTGAIETTYANVAALFSLSDKQIYSIHDNTAYGYWRSYAATNTTAIIRNFDNNMIVGGTAIQSGTSTVLIDLCYFQGINAVKAPNLTLYWGCTKTSSTLTFTVYSDSGLTTKVCEGTATDNPGNYVQINLSELNSSGITGVVRANYTSNDADSSNIFNFNYDTSHLPLAAAYGKPWVIYDLSGAAQTMMPIGHTIYNNTARTGNTGTGDWAVTKTDTTGVDQNDWEVITVN